MIHMFVVMVNLFGCSNIWLQNPNSTIKFSSLWSCLHLN